MEVFGYFHFVLKNSIIYKTCIGGELMNKNQIYWAKSVILSYGHLERICNAIDKQIDRLACNSCIGSTSWSNIYSVSNVSNKIIELTQNKIDYINIKVLVEKVLESINKKFSKILILKYIQNLKTADVAKVLKVSDRTLFRNANKAFAEFADKMSVFGFTSEKMEVKYLSDGLIGALYKKIKSEDEELEKQEKLSREKNFNFSNGFELDFLMMTKKV